MSEGDLLVGVIELAGVLGVLAHHCRPARTDKGWRTPIMGDKGFLDVVLVGRRGVLFRELKSADGRVTLEQKVWLARLRAAGEDVDVWRPSDWPDRIRAELEAIR